MVVRRLGRRGTASDDSDDGDDDELECFRQWK